MTLGLPDGTVALAPYHASWPLAFAEEAERLHQAVGALPLVLEHIGSTAVPGLMAKPVLDLMGGIPADTDIAPYVAAFEAAGYVHRGEHGIPGRQLFRRGQPRTHHLHLVVQGGNLWREHLAFRDALRTHDALRDAYATLKQELAQRFPGDRASYIDGKSLFVRGVVQTVLAQLPHG